MALGVSDGLHHSGGEYHSDLQRVVRKASELRLLTRMTLRRRRRSERDKLAADLLESRRTRWLHRSAVS